jgi:hypothetical protein
MKKSNKIIQHISVFLLLKILEIAAVIGVLIFSYNVQGWIGLDVSNECTFAQANMYAGSQDYAYICGDYFDIAMGYLGTIAFGMLITITFLFSLVVTIFVLYKWIKKNWKVSGDIVNG